MRIRAYTVLVSVLVVACLASVASAHEHRPVGPVEMVVGWDSEPAYVGFLNGVQVTIHDPGGKPVTDAGESLEVEVTFGDQKTEPMTLEAAFGNPGRYVAPLIPTRPGDYAFHLTGEVQGQTIDQTFSSADKKFDAVKDDAGIEFPAKDPSRAELAQRLTRLDPRLASVSGTASSAEDTASLARLLGIVGIVLGAVALIVTLASRRRTT